MTMTKMTTTAFACAGETPASGEMKAASAAGEQFASVRACALREQLYPANGAR